MQSSTQSAAQLNQTSTATTRGYIPAVEPLPLSRHANDVADFVARRLFGVMLSAVELEAKRYGYVFERGSVPAPLSNDTLIALGKAALKAQMLFESPGATEEQLVQYITGLSDRQAGARAATELLSALESLGIVIAEHTFARTRRA